MGNSKKTLYPFAEMYEVATTAQASVTITTVPAGTIITRVLAKIKTAGTTSGNIIIGDSSDDDGYIVAVTGTAAADTVYGDIPSEIGTYLRVTADSVCGMGCKVYTSETSIVMDCSASLTTEATVDVFIMGYRYFED